MKNHDVARLRHLTEQQAIFVRECSRGISAEDAARLAGYSSPLQESYRLKAHAGVQAAIAQETRRFLYTEAAPAAIKLLYDFMVDPKVDAKLRVTCAKTVADRAGFIAPKASNPNALEGKSLVDMTADEMKDMALRIQRELAERAAPIIDNAPSIERNGSQAIDILD